jgi:hypothetical protein
MADGICFAGLDVHARKTAGAAVQLGSGEVFRAQMAGSPGEVIDWLRSLLVRSGRSMRRARRGLRWPVPRERQAWR